MSFVSDYLTPVLKMVFVVAFVGWIAYLIYRMFKGSGNLILWLKYKVFNKRPPEHIIEWCLNANEKDYPPEKVRKIFLVKGYNPKVTNEITYIYTMIRKMKGGLATDEQRIREGNIKTLPEI